MSCPEGAITDRWLSTRPRPRRRGRRRCAPARTSTGPRLDAYLRANIAGLDGPFSVLQFPNGSANLTYLVRIGDTELVVRRPPFGRLAPGAHDMRREFRAVDALSRHFDRAAHAYLFCDDHDVIGSDFLVVEYRHGVVVWDHVPDRDGPPRRRRPAHRVRRRRRARRPAPARPGRRRPRRPRPARRVRRATGVGVAQALGPRRHRTGAADGRRRRSAGRHDAGGGDAGRRCCTTTTRSTTASSTRPTPTG